MAAMTSQGYIEFSSAPLSSLFHLWSALLVHLAHLFPIIGFSHISSGCLLILMNEEPHPFATAHGEDLLQMLIGSYLQAFWVKSRQAGRLLLLLLSHFSHVRICATA